MNKENNDQEADFLKSYIVGAIIISLIIFTIIAVYDYKKEKAKRQRIEMLQTFKA